MCEVPETFCLPEHVCCLQMKTKRYCGCCCDIWELTQRQA